MRTQHTNHGAFLGATKPDPYAALKKAHAEGKVIQLETVDAYGKKSWSDIENPCFSSTPEAYRIKPEAPPFQLPPPPPGVQWHRVDGWKEGDLPQGMRPCALGETGEYEMRTASWVVGAYPNSPRPYHSTEFYRTTRPLTFTHAGKTWMWHRPGDPMPCDGERVIFTLRQDKHGVQVSNPQPASFWWWEDAILIGWRYADEKKTVPLGPEDVPPMTVLRGAGEIGSQGWCAITSCSETGIRIWRHSESQGFEITWERLRESGSQINRSIPLTGKWNPDAWAPCSKEVPA